MKKAMAALVLMSAGLALVANDAEAQPRHRNAAEARTAPAMIADNNGRLRPAGAAVETVRGGAAGARRGRPLELGYARVAASSNVLIAEARKYLGGNPTGRSSLWCGAFMDLVLKRTGHKGGGNLARGYARYGTRVAGPQVGAIAVMTRKGGGHVGIVTGIDSNGNVVVLSGNHNNRVAEAVYPRSRVVTYVVP